MIIITLIMVFSSFHGAFLTRPWFSSPEPLKTFGWDDYTRRVYTLCGLWWLEQGNGGVGCNKISASRSAFSFLPLHHHHYCHRHRKDGQGVCIYCALLLLLLLLFNKEQKLEKIRGFEFLNGGCAIILAPMKTRTIMDYKSRNRWEKRRGFHFNGNSSVARQRGGHVVNCLLQMRWKYFFSLTLCDSDALIFYQPIALRLK